MTRKGSDAVGSSTGRKVSEESKSSATNKRCWPSSATNKRCWPSIVWVLPALFVLGCAFVGQRIYVGEGVEGGTPQPRFDDRNFGRRESKEKWETLPSVPVADKAFECFEWSLSSL